jgi:hypothetical protein
MFLFTNRCGKISGGATPLFNFLQYEGAGTQNLNIEIKKTQLMSLLPFKLETL